MPCLFDDNLASALEDFVVHLRADAKVMEKFAKQPTETVVAHMRAKGARVPDMFHAHAVHRGNPLPEEPRLATTERYIYIFRKDGMFEFKRVPGSPHGDDAVLQSPAAMGACACCNCCAVEI